MSASAQSRLNRLLPSRSKSERATPDSLPWFEQEIVDYQQGQLARGKATAGENDGEGPAFDDEVNSISPAKAPKKKKAATAGARRSSATPRQNRHVPGTDPDQVIYLPRGIRRGGVAATDLLGSDEEHDEEPTSSGSTRIGHFCLWSLVSKFPYKYMQDPENRVSQRFFASEKIFRRNWNVHYLLGPDSVGCKPLILVPFQEVQKLVDEISAEFNVHVEVPAYPFQLSFYDDGCPAPKFLGVVNSKDRMSDLLSEIPLTESDHDVIPTSASETQKRDHAAWREKLERAYAAEKKKKDAIKAKKHQKRELAITENSNQLKRAQRYLGLQQELPSIEVVRHSESTPRAAEIGDAVAPPAQRLDVDKPTPFPFEDQTIIIAIDIESWEMDHNIVTEIGVSTIDTEDLVGLAPGEQGQNWIKKIRSRHFRIKGRESLANVKFCHGNPEMFQFGTSEFVAAAEAADAVDSCFESPYSAGFECAGPPGVDEEGLRIATSPAALDTSRYGKGQAQPRNILLVGHDINTDIAYLSKLGSSIFGSGSPLAEPAESAARKRRVLSSIREYLDTITLHKTLNKDDQAKSLMKLCFELDIEAWYAHNAGNDARYTLEVFIKLVIKARQQEDEAEAEARKSGMLSAEATLQEIEKEQHIQAKTEAARWVTEAELAAY